jgi:hypothetical protein
MSTLRPSALLGAVTLFLGAIGSAQAQVFEERFDAPFPAWESDWFGTQSTARNYYCQGPQGCAHRDANVDGLWVIGGVDAWVAPIEVSFAAEFGASLTSFQLDIAGYTPTTLQAFDMANNLIFSEEVALTFGALSNPGVYSNYTITSTTGISRFTFSGGAAGNTSIDNLVATTREAEHFNRLDFVEVPAIPEPETYALMLAGLGGIGFMARQRRRSGTRST